MKHPIDRIRNLSYLDEETGCWIFTGSGNKGKSEDSYGHTKVLVNGRWVTQYIHRLSYEHHIGPIPDGLRVLHKCDRPRCWNPAHLFVCTAKYNTEDMVRKGRVSCGARRYNALLTEDNVREIKLKCGSGQWTRIEAAATFNVARYVIDAICNGRRWKHVSVSQLSVGG